MQNHLMEKERRCQTTPAVLIITLL